MKASAQPGVLPFDYGTVTQDEVRVLAHAVGLARCSDKNWGRYSTLERCYRNFFTADAGTPNWELLDGLAQRGLVRRARGLQPVAGLDLFHVTEQGFKVLQACGIAPQPRRGVS